MGERIEELLGGRRAKRLFRQQNGSGSPVNTSAKGGYVVAGLRRDPHFAEDSRRQRRIPADWRQDKHPPVS